VRRRQRMSRSIKVTTNGGLIEEEHHLLDADGMMPDDDKVNNPPHYQSMTKDLNIDCITAMRAAFGDYEAAIFCKLNALKYVWRASSKNGNEDIDKASWYLKKYMELGGENQ
jgi:hypothetical protein